MIIKKTFKILFIGFFLYLAAFIAFVFIVTSLEGGRARKETAFVVLGTTRKELIAKLKEPIFSIAVNNDKNYREAARKPGASHVLGPPPCEILEFNVPTTAYGIFVRLENDVVAAHFLSD